MNSKASTLTHQHGITAKLACGNVLAAACPSREVLRDVSSRWGLLALLALRSGTYRYSELKRRIGGISEKMLAQTLQALEMDGFVKRVSLPVVPPHVEYSLTDLGREVTEQLAQLTDWIESNLAQVMQARVAFAMNGKSAAGQPGRARVVRVPSGNNGGRPPVGDER
jgi:DNA-binding HxlR family transcriptional regulator